MSNKTKRFILPEEEIPHYWYNIQADMVNKPMPPLNPATKQPLKAEDLYPVFAEELCRQELNQTDAWIEIPEQVREMYKYYRSTPLVRAYGLEKALGTPAHIYFKNESVSPMGSHKLNSALPQPLLFFQIRPSALNSFAMPSSYTEGAMRSHRFFRFSEPLAMHTLMPTTSVICRSLSLSPKPMVSASVQPR